MAARRICARVTAAYVSPMRAIQITEFGGPETLVVHAGAGGVGTIAIQLAKRWGAGRVIATASSDDKRALALELGADVAVDSRVPDMNAALREANEGRGVDVVLEMTGGPVFD